MVLIVGASLLLFLAVLLGVQQRRGAIKTVGKDSAPSILAAAKIASGLADMDGSVVNALMLQKGESSDSIQSYDGDRKTVSDGLVTAAQNITYGDAERKPILTLTYGLGSYEEEVSQARTLRERQGLGANIAYNEAYGTLEGKLFPAAKALSDANNAVLTRTYDGVKQLSFVTGVLVGLSGLLLLAALIATQVYLSNRMRRTLNPALLAATVLTLVWLAYTISGFSAAVHHLKVAREDAFGSLEALWKARAVAYDTNTDESRFLMDRRNSAQYEKDFFDKTAQLANFPGETAKDQVYARMQQVASQGTLPPGSTGFLADELNNITFPGEKEAATDTVSKYAAYVLADKTLRDLAASGKFKEAIAFDIGKQQGQSDWAFSQFDDALGKTIKVNQDAFDQAVDQGFADLAGMEIVAFVLAVIVAVLGVIGLRPRLREYTF